ncbi:hypothetical protein F0562_012031 [Nyssa sinensis]|uniref:Uncharacterized protein n=1 Tax=Nyssa sinensis TaxID=561372 RepID=A0A5J4ZSD9_9ASTE|nr:hypothetical protein F0562_012031 [Nyssa sinensis]
MASSQSLHAATNGLHVAKEPSRSLHAKHPVRLTWADQANSGESISKEALDLEKEYGGFLVNPDFLLCIDNHFHGDAKNGGSKKGGLDKGELHARSYIYEYPKSYPSRHTSSSESWLAQAQFGCSPTVVAFQLNTQPSLFSPARTVAIQPKQIAPHSRMVAGAPAAQQPIVLLDLPHVQSALVHRNSANKATISPTMHAPPAVPHSHMSAGLPSLQISSVCTTTPIVQSALLPHGNSGKTACPTYPIVNRLLQNSTCPPQLQHQQGTCYSPLFGVC